MVYTIRSIVGSANVAAGVPYGAGTWWVRAIPIRYFGGAMHGAWEVLMGRAVAMRYPVDGELEAALAETGGINVPNVRDGEAA